MSATICMLFAAVGCSVGLTVGSVLVVDAVLSLLKE